MEDKNKIPKQIIDQVAAAIGEKWNILAEKLGYQPDEVTLLTCLIIYIIYGFSKVLRLSLLLINFTNFRVKRKL